MSIRTTGHRSRAFLWCTGDCMEDLAFYFVIALRMAFPLMCVVGVFVIIDYFIR